MKWGDEGGRGREGERGEGEGMMVVLLKGKCAIWSDLGGPSLILLYKNLFACVCSYVCVSLRARFRRCAFDSVGLCACEGVGACMSMVNVFFYARFFMNIQNISRQIYR